MRKILMVASAIAMAVSMPAFGQGKGNGGDKGGGGGKPAHAGKADKGHGGGKPDKAHGNDGGWARQEMKAERRFEKQEAKREAGWARQDMKAERKRDKDLRKAEARADKQFAKEDKAFRKEERRLAERDGRIFEDRGDRFAEEGRRFGGLEGGCPPGLAKKGNGCMPPGQAKKAFRVGELLPASYYPEYNLPDEYRDWYREDANHSYRYDEGNIYRVDKRTNLISSLIPLLGGGFGVGNLLPAGHDVYNVPFAYRDDFYDTPDSLYRYGDDAIYRVDPHSQMIEGVVALLAGNLNVGQLLPSGYDAYNLPMQYRDQYVDSEEAMYRYADGNIYQVDPQSRMIEQIVAMLT